MRPGDVAAVNGAGGLATPPWPIDLIAPHHPLLEPRVHVLGPRGKISPFSKMQTFALGGLVGGALYKAVDTADSMIGHKNERYKAFGWAAAQLDDVVNLPASRLAALWLIVAAALTPEAWARDAARATWRDAARPLAQRRLARGDDGGALGLKLAGPRV